MAPSEFQKEKVRLEQVYEEIDRQLSITRQTLQNYRQLMLEIRSSLWEEHRISSASDNQMMDVGQQIAELHHRGVHFGLQHELLKKLKAVEKSPYFARMDFHEQGLPEVESLYIGIRSLIDENTNEVLIYDWRAPISSMFYDYGLGPAAYEGPGGVFEGEIYLKRQFRIKDRELVYMFDNELKIDDEVLQEVLSQHTSDKMRTIVNSIQREQNKAIRNDQDPLLLVEGPAGSGKTSVALHRIAYLLYKYRESISSQNIVIFSPSKIFNDYISHVLPELGEENVFQTTFQDYAEQFLGWEWEVESQMAALEALFLASEEKRQEQLQTIAFKSSQEFQKVLANLVEKVTAKATNFFDIKLDQQIIITATEQEYLYNESYSYLAPNKRLGKIYQRILFLLKPLKKERFDLAFKQLVQLPAYENKSWWTIARMAVKELQAELDPILETLRQRFRVNALDLYVQLLTNEELWKQVGEGIPFCQNAAKSLESLEQGKISFEDVVPLLYLKGELEGYPIKREIRHVVVDEVQDYTPLQIKILTKVFPRANFTFVGDIFQSLNPYVWKDSKESLEELFGELDLTTVRLNKSYRSTKEIFHFTSAILAGKSKAETVLRSGELPLVLQTNKDSRLEVIIDQIFQCLEENYQTVALICPTVEECVELYDGLRNKDSDLEMQLIIEENRPFQKGIIVLPIFLAKGLEFDAVILPEVNDKTYPHSDHRHLFYVASSRALHELRMVYTGQPNMFVRNLPQELYNHIK